MKKTIFITLSIVFLLSFDVFSQEKMKEQYFKIENSNQSIDRIKSVLETKLKADDYTFSPITMVVKINVTDQNFRIAGFVSEMKKKGLVMSKIKDTETSKPSVELCIKRCL